MATYTEEELNRALLGLSEGDRSTFRVVFDGLFPLLSKYCARSLGNHADAEDAAQRTLEKLFAQASNYREGRSAAAWALSIAFFECRTLRQRRRRSREQPLDTELSLSERSPEQTVEDRELSLALETAIESLGEVDQAALRELLTREIGDSPASPHLRKRRQRAIFRLKMLWSKLYDI